MTERTTAGRDPGPQDPAAPDAARRTSPVDAVEIARALGRPAPTAQQRAVIESPLGPALVVAGAGSGKTETMANRVLWLLANGHAAPGEILGLTFTRKAAGELGRRIRERVAALQAAGLVPGDSDPFDLPQVSTYNAFANAVYRDNAMLIGREGDGTVLGEASAWQLVREIVVRSDDVRLAGLDRSVDAITGAVLTLGRAVGENVASFDEVRRMAADFRRTAELPPGGRGAYAEVVRWAADVGALEVLAELAERYEEEKRRRGLVEYSDQVALALTIVRRIPEVRQRLRERHRIVLLDEYQDTSVVQTWLLAEIFGGHPVMAVGDPNQSIYGWRGASAGNLAQFPAQFRADDRPTGRFALSTSWRNGHGILEAANAIAAPLSAAAGVDVERLEAGPAATSRPIEVRMLQTVQEEADLVAAWFARVLAGPVPDAASEAAPQTAALLLRTRAHQDLFTAALAAHGVPFHVLGVGGLLAHPEIADLVCALRVITDPEAGGPLVRLLAGARWRVGVRDLRALHDVASWLGARDWAQHPLDPEVRSRLRMSVAAGEGASLIDALDMVAHVREGHTILAGFSDEGRRRLRRAGVFFAALRERVGLGLRDVVTLVARALRLDIETVANEGMPQHDAAMEAFDDALGDYLAVDENASLAGFLAWLREAEWRDGLSPRPEDPEPGTVQVLTVHGSKGLEWDHVAVPRMVDGEFPGPPREGSRGWLRFGALPYEFRGDAGELPVLGWRSAATRKELKDAVGDFSARVLERHRAEERRLAYVAVTRARHSLLMTGAFWARQVKPRRSGEFLADLERAGIIPPLPTEPDAAENPVDVVGETILWPRDPLGGRRRLVEEAAAAVRRAAPGSAGPWQRDIDLLLAERAERERADRLVELPRRVPASRFKDFVHDPASVAASLHRPMPERPYRATRLGTLFHSWVEERSGRGAIPEELGEWDDVEPLLADADDDADGAARLERLIDTFEHSRWAGLKPIEVEREIHLPFEGRIVVCKLDAVYRIDGRYQLVDWKTGKPPADEEDLRLRRLQLALYRLAYARWAGIDEELIDACFYFVADDVVIEPRDLPDHDELVALWRAAVAG